MKILLTDDNKYKIINFIYIFIKCEIYYRNA